MSRYFILIALLAGAFACAESGGGLAEGGIGGSGISQGPITEFGSIFVNGIEWELDGAEVEIDGVVEPGLSSDQDLSDLFNRGMVVRVEGTIDTSTEPPTGQAERVFFDHEIEGPVSDVPVLRNDLGDPGQFKELTVLGKKILIEEGATNFSDGPAGFDTIVVDDVVAISGLVDEVGVVWATYVEKKGPFVPGVTVVELKGKVLAPLTETTFMLGSVTVEFGSADLSDLPEGVVEDGMVEVKGTLSDVGEIQASKIELDIPRDDDDVAEDEFSTTGFVNCTLDCADFDFSIGNQRVDAMGAEFKNGDASMLEDGRRVKVEGELIDGLLKANEIEFKDQEARVHAAFEDVDDIDLVAGSFKLLGIEIQVIPSTRVIDFDLGNLMAGESLEVRGIVNAPGVITAFRVRNRGIDDRGIRLDGPVEFNETAGQFTIMGVTVFTDDLTVFEIDDPMGTTEPVSKTCFFENLNEGDFVEVRGDKDFPAIFTDASDAATDVTLVKDNPCPAP
jgi:hypothetical protein